MNKEREEQYAKPLKSRVAGVVLATLALASCGNMKGDGFKGGCTRFGVIAQNRWTPLGTAVRAEPDILATIYKDGIPGNQTIAVDGWVHMGIPAYPLNSPPWNSDIWYHLANRKEAWIAFAAVRGAATIPDPTGAADGGQPAPTPPQCEGTYKP